MIQFIPLGGAYEIGASCFYLNIAGTGILFDCGIHPRKSGLEALPNFDLLKELPLDFAIISHSHQDHIGALPFLIQRFPHTIIYSTCQTKEIADATLHNAVNILSQNSNSEDNLKIYTHDEIDLLVRSIHGINYGDVIKLTGMRHSGANEIKLSFHDAGHILGAAGILVEYADKKIFYTGDINLSDQSIMIGCDLSGIKNIDTLILETTYGSTDSGKLGTWNGETERLTKFINKALHNGGSILIPVFALGKTQELLALLFEQMRKGKLTETNIYTGGVGRDISHIYDRNRYITRRRDSGLLLKEIPQQNIFDVEDLNHFKKNPGIVLASSGMMLPGTTSYKLLGYWLQQKNFSVCGVGYMDKETPGYRLMNSKTGDEIRLTDFSELKKVHCEVERFFFPSHSKREDLLRIVAKVNPGRVVLIHGEEKSKNWIGEQILSKFNHIKVNSAGNGISIQF
ncbi:MAG: MBL fold metallo-hydrolase [Melioribacteraceae bacterium]|nr:MBL fold metallo-hydrolase [Melioribacteraceae bacterium]